MSDGNFNRALLPHTPYQSGLKAGKSMARMHALQVFKALLQEQNPELSEASIDSLCQEFNSRLSRLL